MCANHFSNPFDNRISKVILHRSFLSDLPKQLVLYHYAVWVTTQYTLRRLNFFLGKIVLPNCSFVRVVLGEVNLCTSTQRIMKTHQSAPSWVRNVDLPDDAPVIRGLKGWGHSEQCLSCTNSNACAVCHCSKSVNITNIINVAKDASNFP